MIYREQREKKLKESAIEGQEQGEFKKMDLSQLHAEVDARQRRITYRNQSGQKQFTDTGPRIEVHTKFDAELDAALKVAAQKYGGRITLTGSGPFREQAARAATRLGITVLDKDLASIASNERHLSQHQSKKPSRNTAQAAKLGASRGKGDKSNER